METTEPDAIIFDDNEMVDLDDKTITKVLELMKRNAENQQRDCQVSSGRMAQRARECHPNW